ncbi:MAG: hypothetical protein L0206_00115 [Actinobacteria bacterium]|nr:hypothetical protein [Actinomycetota bacterium]
MVGYFIVVLVGVAIFPSFQDLFDRFDAQRSRWLVEVRTPWLTDVALVVNGLAAVWTIRALRWFTIAVLIGFRRWRHLFVFLGAIVVTEVLVYLMTQVIGRERPFGIEVLAGWQGFAMP